MQPGDTLELKHTVAGNDLASQLALDIMDDFPAVLATSRMIALMELAAARLMQTELGTGELSVGVNVNVTHIAATLQGDMVRAVAEFTGMQDKLFLFDVTLYDAGGKAGAGTHTRAIVNTTRLLRGAAERAR